jgi:hypothetical protein
MDVGLTEKDHLCKRFQMQQTTGSNGNTFNTARKELEHHWLQKKIKKMNSDNVTLLINKRFFISIISTGKQFRKSGKGGTYQPDKRITEKLFQLMEKESATTNGTRPANLPKKLMKSLCFHPRRIILKF